MLRSKTTTSKLKNLCYGKWRGCQMLHAFRDPEDEEIWEGWTGSNLQLAFCSPQGRISYHQNCQENRTFPSVFHVRHLSVKSQEASLWVRIFSRFSPSAKNLRPLISSSSVVTRSEYQRASSKRTVTLHLFKIFLLFHRFFSISSHNISVDFSC